MTDRATFGDFAGAVRHHLQSLPGPGARPVPAARELVDAGQFTRSLRAAVTAMARYASDSSAIIAAVPRADRTRLAPWIRAAGRTSEALASAAALLQPDPGESSRPSQQRPAPVVTGLGAAAAGMILARDVLHTHTAFRADGRRADRSEWGPVVASVPIARAVLWEVAGWARQIAPLGGQLAVSGLRGPRRAHRNVNAACQWLWALDWAIQAAHEHQPVPAADLHLLHAIPVNALAPRHQPADGDPVSRLCQGTIDTAERVREAARATAPHASWSPALTMESFRQTAACCTVISHNCATILRTLASRTAQDRAPSLSAQLAASAAAADDARQAWLHAAGAWDQITTDTRGAISQTAAEAADLALWTGRLAYADPAWTPQHGPSEQLRPPDDLAPAKADLQRAVAAAHHACHTLAWLAETDQRQLRTASMTGRLVVPTCSLPETFDIPHRFAPAPATRAEQVLFAYHDAQAASDQATERVAEAAVATRSPSRILTTAHNAAQTHGNCPPAGKKHVASELPALRHASKGLRGPVEQILLDLDVTSPAELQHAAALDQAAGQLILRAAQAQPHSSHRDLARSAGTAEIINHLLASSDRAAALLHPPNPSRAPQAEIEP